MPAREQPDEQHEFPVVGIGASAGGLEACTQLVAALPDKSGMAFILVQHLDPYHPSMMVELLGTHTAMPVLQAADRMLLQPDHFYIIPPDAYLAVRHGRLALSAPGARHGARLPFDFLLASLAEEYGPRAVCIILSGTGSDGSLGLRAIKQHGGRVIAQLPDEATYDGMPRSAIETGEVDQVLAVADMPAALARHASGEAEVPGAPGDPVANRLADILDLLRERAKHDFRLYKPGTLERRIERRMAMVAIEARDIDRYVELLRNNQAELALLARDLLINVTSFFRDPKVFALLERDIIPGLVSGRAAGDALRIWIAGCSTGQETYSLAMLFSERMAAEKNEAKLQVFASDADPEAVASAREGFYPHAIETEVSQERLDRFFTREDHGYRVRPELRASIVFAMQDVLADPPFSRLDFISCRNLLIYLRPEAQARVISLFHFALRPGGLLLLGNAETIGPAAGLFDAVSKSERLYRHAGRSGPSPFRPLASPGDGLRIRAISGQAPLSARQASLADICRQLVLDVFAPAAVLVNSNHECLYFLGPTDTYLRIAPGHHTSDLLAIARLGLRGRLRSAIARAKEVHGRVIERGCQLRDNGSTMIFSIDVQPVVSGGEELFLVCFVEEHKAGSAQAVTATGADHGTEPPGAAGSLPAAAARPAVAGAADPGDLAFELAATRAELRSVQRDLETSSEEQKAINEEALSINEEFQSTNEELLTSKEELQSLNEELTALNSQLQETLERQRTTSDDLQNVLYSTDVATLFLDPDLRIRFFTPASKALFNIIDGDVGRPLTDLRPLGAEDDLADDAGTVLKTLQPLERETSTPDGTWFLRRILPYRAQDPDVRQGGAKSGRGGLVITFTDVTERKKIARALDQAKHHSELANLAKTRFLAAASHDLRQPLQTLALLHGLLEKAAEGERAQRLVARQGETLNAMSGMLSTLLDINEIESGVVQPHIVSFAVNPMLLRLRDEFAYHAQAQGIELRMVPCSLKADSDPRLLEQMLRNLLTNALKYTKRGRVLIGCRRRPGVLSIEIWDTGVGIPQDKLQAIFDEYYQVDNAARERNRGLGLGLSIVQRLSGLLDHRVRVGSRPGRGSVFAIDIARHTGAFPAAALPAPASADAEPLAQTRRNPAQRSGVILVVEDDPDVRELLQIFLQEEGHIAAATRDGNTALDLVGRGSVRPDLIIADYNLPNGLDGLKLALQLREMARADIPVVILTGDISSGAIQRIAEHHVLHLTKPVKLDALTKVIAALLPGARPHGDATALEAGGQKAALMTPAPGSPALVSPALVSIVDDDADVLAATRSVLEDDGYEVACFETSESFLAAYTPGRAQCLLVDGTMPGISGVDLLLRLRQAGHHVASIVITGQSDIKMAVTAMQAGALDFIEKPIGRAELLASIARALERTQDSRARTAWQEQAAAQIAELTPRQRQIMTMILAGQPNKIIAADLAISQRTVENHRASIMHKTGAASLPALARLALAAASQAE
jgi:two-component system CheB/CheR fusion protein